MYTGLWNKGKKYISSRWSPFIKLQSDWLHPYHFSWSTKEGKHKWYSMYGRLIWSFHIENLKQVLKNCSVLLAKTKSLFSWDKLSLPSKRLQITSITFAPLTYKIIKRISPWRCPLESSVGLISTGIYRGECTISRTILCGGKWYPPRLM